MLHVFGTFFTCLAVGFGCMAMFYMSLPYLVLTTVFFGIALILFDTDEIYE